MAEGNTSQPYESVFAQSISTYSNIGLDIQVVRTGKVCLLRITGQLTSAIPNSQWTVVFENAPSFFGVPYTGEYFSTDSGKRFTLSMTNIGGGKANIRIYPRTGEIPIGEYINFTYVYITN